MIRIVLPFIALAVVVAPAWWLAGRLQDSGTRPFFRLLCAIGFGLVGYLSFVNLLGRAIGHATLLASAYIALSLLAAVLLWLRRPSEISLRPLLSSWRSWGPAVLIALALGLPEWVLTVSTPYWDEVASSSIHLTGPNQFAEGVFPPRHNALPDISIKYHYAFIVLSGTMRWLTGFSSNTSIDLVTTCLWLFTILFVVYWLRDLSFSRMASWWGGFATLMGGGLTWVYLRTVEAYKTGGYEKTPAESLLWHKYQAGKGFFDNLVGASTVPSAHLRNADGTLSSLPWDIASQFQQHAVAMGIPLTLLAFYLLVRLLSRKIEYGAHFAVTVFTFGILVLGHAVFGGAAAVTAGLVMLILWFREPSKARFAHVTIFTVLVTILALAHGGPFAAGEVYGANSDVLKLRDGFGYFTGGVSGFINWNLAGFGIPLVLAILAWIVRPQRFVDAPDAERTDAGVVRMRTLAFLVFTVFTVFSYFIPQFTFYSSETSGVELFTEISKFFFAAHLGFALLSVFGVAYLLRRWHWASVVPLMAASVIAPLMIVYVHSTTALEAKTLQNARGDSLAAAGYKWLGFYRSPYFRNSIEQMAGDTLRKLKHSSTDSYYDASRDERRHGFMSELLIFGGSIFTVTPSRYERTGSGFRLAERPVAERMVQNGRIARLRPGSAEGCNCKWYYARPGSDLTFLPMVVRSRFARAVAEGYFTPQFAGMGRVLYSIDKPTADLDDNLHLYWRPRVVSQARTDWNGDGRNDLIFYDYVNKKVIAGGAVVDVPDAFRQELGALFVGRFPGDGRASLLLGHLRDTDFRLGRRIEDIIEQNNWGWSYRPAGASQWDPEYARWDWDGDIPLVGDLNNDGFDTHLTYRHVTGEWYMAPAVKLSGPSMPAADYPLPFVGRFLPGSTGDLALWSLRTGAVAMQSLNTGRRVDFKWGGNPGEVLVPGDYDGDGYDEMAIWNGTNGYWYFGRPPGGATSQFQFGTPTSVPLPADYNSDGRVDVAYWEPRANRIFVTYSAGRSIDLVIDVPPHAIPMFVNME